MKRKSTLVIVCLAVALFMTVGTTTAQAQPCGVGFDGCCVAEWLVYTPFIAAGGALMIMGAIVTLPLSFGCGPSTCGCALLKGFPCCLFPKCGQP